MDVSYRKAVIADAEPISAMMWRYVDCPWTAAQVIDEINNPDAPFYVATSGGSVIGFLSGVCAADECEISDIAVELPFRRQKIATGLFRLLRLDMAARGVKNVYLLVRENNIPAVTLYGKLGFTDVGRRKGYYNGTADAVVMKLEL